MDGVKLALMIAIPVCLGVILLLTILGLIFRGVRKRMERHILEKFDRDELLGACPGANMIGLRSAGGCQVRGNGALVLTKDELYFYRAVPAKEFHIPVGKITGVKLEKSFCGKNVLHPILVVEYEDDNGSDAIGFVVKAPETWQASIQGLIDSTAA